MDSITPYLHLPFTDHTLVFLLVLTIILLAPMIFSRLRIPHIIGMILAGVLVGEHGFNLLERDGSFELFGKVGIYYIMFLAGLEMDLMGLKMNRRNGLIFGLLTSVIPFLFGVISGGWLLGVGSAASILIACILTSHTLVAYPIVGRYNLGRSKSVMISVAATMVALLLALLVLAILSGTYKGDTDAWYWILFVLKFIVYLLILFFGFPRVIGYFFRAYTDRVMQFIFVLAAMFLAAWLAELCGLEGILGAFLAGLVFNRFIPRTSPLMNRVEFVGNALFIPYFLIGVGMLVNLKPLFTSWAAVKVVLVMVVAGTLSKYIAAWGARRIFKMSASNGLMMFGLSEAHAAGALAMVMVGTRMEIAPGVPLMDSSILDGVVVMILISCIISSVATDVAARKLKIEEGDEAGDVERAKTDDEKIMIPINYPETIPVLIQTAIMMRNSVLGRGLICLNVENDEDPSILLSRHAKECLLVAEQTCAAADVPVQTQRRLAVNFVNGVIHAFHENDASEIIIGLHHQRKEQDQDFLGRFARGLIDGLSRQITIVHLIVPINTIRCVHVAVPEQAQFEPGFYRWVERLARVAVELSSRIVFYAAEETAESVRSYLNYHHPLIRDEYAAFDEGESLLQLAESVKKDHLFVLIMARQGTISYEKRMSHMPQVMARVFANKNFLIIYPDQESGANDMPSFSEPHGRDVVNPSKLTQWLSKYLNRMG